MKKIYTLAIGFIMLSALKSNAQDTLIYESFNFQSFYDALVSDIVPPPGVTGDPTWYTYDRADLADGSGQSRDGWWFAAQPFSPVDTTGNVVIASNSWFDSPAQAQDFLITPSITLGAHDTLFWKSAPSQTPRYLDGYQVLLSTTTNDDIAFSNVLFTAAEMTVLSSAGEDTVYSHFTFAPAGDFVHGQDGTHIDPTDITATHWLHAGQLQPHSVPLDAFAGQPVYIAFYHNSFDDNLISVDDFLIRGQHAAMGINENKADFSLSVFPNPAHDQAQVNYNLAAESPVTVTIYDITGKVIATDNKGTQSIGRHLFSINTADMAKGFYTVSIQTNNGRNTTKLIVQ